MTSWTEEELYDGLERWLKTRRDQYPRATAEAGTMSTEYAWSAVDRLLNELHDRRGAGLVPLQRIMEEDPEPKFVIRGKDMYAVPTVLARAPMLRHDGHLNQADEEDRAALEIAEWQARHPDRIKVPDHKHRPVQRDPLRCPTCDSRQPSMHPAVSGGGEITQVCPHPFHGKG